MLRSKPPRSISAATGSYGPLMCGRTVHAAAAVCVIGLGSGCFMPREAGEHMQAELLALRGEVARLSQKLERSDAAQQEEHARDTQALDTLRGTIESFTQTARRADADMGSQIELMVADVQRLRGALEENEHRLTETEARLQQELASRLLALKQSTVREEKEATSATAKASAPRNKKELLRYGLDLLRKGNKADGRGVLRDVVKRYGKERGLADEALFALGASALVDGQHELALRDLVRLVDGFANNAHQAEAYYDIGVCSEALGRFDDAKTFYTEVQTNFADGPFAAKARDRLKLMAQKLRAPAAARKAAPSDSNARPQSAPAPAAANGNSR